MKKIQNAKSEAEAKMLLEENRDCLTEEELGRVSGGGFMDILKKIASSSPQNAICGSQNENDGAGIGGGTNRDSLARSIPASEPGGAICNDTCVK